MRASACIAWLACLAALMASGAAQDVELVSEAGPGRGSRALLQSGTSCPFQIPGCLPRRCTTRTVESQKDVYVCLRCRPGFIPALNGNKQHIMQCICPAGTYLDDTLTSCEPCPRGAYCPGGSRTARKPTDSLGAIVSCGAEGVTQGITTKGDRATKQADCVAEPGWVLDPSNAGVPARCTGNTYAPSNNRLKSCLRCQSGLEAPPFFAGDRTDKQQVCQVPPGRFWELNVVRDCPKGTYREYYVKVVDKAAIRCLPCPAGWTTAGIATKTIDECNVLVAGYLVPGVDPGDETTSVVPADFGYTDAEACPMGFYYDGRDQIFGCRRCPFGSTTQDTGATGLEECLVPPGYFLAQTDDSTQGILTKCPGNVDGQGYFRSGWVGYKLAISQLTGDAAGADVCTPCGTGILSEPRQFDEIIDPAAVIAFDPYPGLVPATGDSCYINAGWGIVFDPDNLGKLRAIPPCPTNTYGVANKTFGLNQAPCKACSQNLYAAEGSTSYTACKNPGGFGYNSEGANQCAHDFWTPDKGMQPCIQCPPGRKTLYVPGDGQYQDEIEDCLIPPGWGVFQAKSDDPWAPANRTASMWAQPCPMNWYSPGDPAGALHTTNVMCQPCPAGTGTTMEGSATCDACAPGYGIPASKPASTSVTDCELCTCGTYHSGGGLRCSSCPTTVFNHPVGGPFTSQGISFSTGLTGPETCVPVHSQLPTPAGHMLSIDTSLFQAPTPAADVAACITTCPSTMCCIAQFEELTDTTGTCRLAILPPVGPGYTGARLYYKLPPSELIAPASIKDDEPVKAKTQAAGVYTRCVMDAAWEAKAASGWVGISANPNLVEETDRTKLIEFGECTDEPTCQAKCERLATCWGFLFVPGKGWAIRGGEDQIGYRSFMNSPDMCAPAIGPPDGSETTDDLTCPPGTGGMFPCLDECTAGTYNDGTSANCMACPANTMSGPGAASCDPIVITTCPAGKQSAPSCSANCTGNTYNDGSFGTCQPCPGTTVPAPGAGSCMTPPPTVCPAGYQGLPACLNKCLNNTFNNGSFATCQPCPTGKVADQGAAACTDPPPTSCPPGRQGLPSCNQLCPAGTYNPGAAVCLDCPQYMTSGPGAANCTYVTCPPGHSVLPDCSTHCTPGTYQDGTGTTCQPCPLNYNSGTAASKCYQMPLPTPSTCTPRPTTSVVLTAVEFTCPTASDNSWQRLQPTNTGLPARCTKPPGINCANPPKGLFETGTDMVATSDGNCACKDWDKGFIPAKPSGKNKVACVQAAMWLPGTSGAPGIWQRDVQAGDQMCDGAQSCWDMCFFCDGRPRYVSDTPGARRAGIAGRRPFSSSSCAAQVCPLDPVQSQSGKRFADMCDDYRNGAAAAAAGSTSPNRPENTVATVFKTSGGVPANWGQKVLVKFGGVV